MSSLVQHACHDSKSSHLTIITCFLDSLRMIMVALSNGYHFWGLERDPSCEDDQEGPDQDVAEYPCTDRIAEIWNEDSVSNQLTLIQCLQEWDPWAVPTATLIENFEKISSVGPLDPGAAMFKARQFAFYQLTREQHAYEEPPFIIRDSRCDHVMHSMSPVIYMNPGVEPGEALPESRGCSAVL